MMFLKAATLLASAALAAANTITFQSQDSTDRTIYFVANAGLAYVSSVDVPGNSALTVTLPEAWIGNWYAVPTGQPDVPGMLGEVAFQGWNGITYFDVSAIVNPNDHDGVKMMWPAAGLAPTSGCEVFPCDNAYYLPDDIQTKTTYETDLICTLGGGSSSWSRRDAEAADAEEKAEDSPSVARQFVTGVFGRSCQ